MKLFYLGPEGTYTHILAEKIFSKGNIELVPINSINNIIEKTAAEDASLGLIPVENNTSTTIHESINGIFEHNLRIVGEASLQIKLNLIGKKGAKLSDIKKVYSKDAALNQTSKFLKKNKFMSEAVDSTAKGAEIVLASPSNESGFIGSDAAAKVKGLEILVENIGDYQTNKTRFVLISQSMLELWADPARKLTVIFQLTHEPGSLAKLLTKLAEQNANLTKIESKPIPETDWEYQFWADIVLEDASDSQKISEIFRQGSLTYKILGQYPVGEIY